MRMKSSLMLKQSHTKTSSRSLYCSGLCFIQIGAVEVEISFFIYNQQLMRILTYTKPSVVNYPTV